MLPPERCTHPDSTYLITAADGHILHFCPACKQVVAMVVVGSIPRPLPEKHDEEGDAPCPTAG